MLAGWEAGYVAVGKPLVGELVAPVSDGAQCSGHKRQWGRRAGWGSYCLGRKRDDSGQHRAAPAYLRLLFIIKYNFRHLLWIFWSHNIIS